MESETAGRRVRMGTAPYMAPEQYHYEQNVTPEADVFAMGMLLWRMLAGYLPVHPSNKEGLEAMYSGKTRPKELSTMGLGVSSQVSDAVKAALRVDPARRPRDAGAFLEALGVSPNSSSLSTSQGSSYESEEREQTDPTQLASSPPPADDTPFSSPFRQPVFWVVMGLVVLWMLGS